MTIDARDFGAAGDSRTMDTEALQRAIDACARTGGRVILQGGVFLTGTLRLRSHVELHIEAGATLLASPRCGDYPPIALARVNAAMLPRGRASCLLLAEDCENVALTGRGTIDCSGSSFVTPAPPAPTKPINAPRASMEANSKRIILSGYMLHDEQKSQEQSLPGCDIQW